MLAFKINAALVAYPILYPVRILSRAKIFRNIAGSLSIRAGNKSTLLIARAGNKFIQLSKSSKMCAMFSLEWCGAQQV